MESVSLRHHVIIVPGLGDEVRPLKLICRNWNSKFSIHSHFLTFGWRSKSQNFDTSLESLQTLIDELHKDNTIKLSLLGTSAGGSAVINALASNPDKIHRVINVCGRLTVGINVKPTLKQAAKTSSIFEESVIRSEKALSLMPASTRNKILAIVPSKDGVVPVETMVFDGINVVKMTSANHLLNIFLALTLHRKKIINFIKQS